MKKLGTLLLSGALTLGIGVAAIGANGLAMAQVMASGIGAESAAVTVSASDVAPSPVAAKSSAAKNEAAASGADAGEKLSVMKKLPNGHTIIVDYYFDKSDSTVKADVIYDAPDGRDEQRSGSYVGKEAESWLERAMGTEQYEAWAKQAGAPTAGKAGRFVEGKPGVGDVAGADAISIGVKALTGKYALNSETLDRFIATAVFYSVYDGADKPTWWVNLYPADSADYSEIGSYTAEVDTATGGIIRLLSAADGKG